MDQPPALHNTFGAAYVGVVLSAVLYGVSCSQVFYYFQHYSKKDGPGTKAVVIATLVSDTIHQALISHVDCVPVYTYVITNYYTPEKLDDIVWSLVVEVLFNAITALLVQTFFAVRIWGFSQRNLPITIALATFIVGGFVSAMVYSVKALTMTTFTQLGALKPLSMTVNALAGDVLITVVFCTLLHRARSNLQSSNTMINLLIAFSVQTGMLTSFCAIGSLISIVVSPNTFIYISFYFLLGRLYCNSLLATLNVRKAIRGRGHNNLGISLPPIEESNDSTMSNHKEVHINVGSMEYITGDKLHGCDGDPPFSHSNTENSQAVEAEYELESGRKLPPRRASF